jgi:hypothetical protein
MSYDFITAPFLLQLYLYNSLAKEAIPELMSRSGALFRLTPNPTFLKPFAEP